LREYLVRFGIRQGLVFRSESGGIVDPTNFRRRVWLPAVKHAGLEGPTPHALRHVHARWLIEANQHPKVIAKRLGHSSIQVTFDVYGGLLHGFDEGAAEAIAAVFRNAAVTKM
jgi:integrase